MSTVLPGAGTGPKITAKFKSKVFSFADVVVTGNSLTLYQISEPLLTRSSATPLNPAPFGTDVNGAPLNDPIPDVLVDPATGNVVTPPADGPSALLDKFTVTKPDLEGDLVVRLNAPATANLGTVVAFRVDVTNNSSYALNGVQIVLTLPGGTTFVGAASDSLTVQGHEVVATLGRLVPGAGTTVEIGATVDNGLHDGANLEAQAVLRSSTALPVSSNKTSTRVGSPSTDSRE
jgi:uncharacterized repeat protein (TIGR01451 family)